MPGASVSDVFSLDRDNRALPFVVAGRSLLGGESLDSLGIGESISGAVEEVELVSGKAKMYRVPFREIDIR